MWRSEIAEPRVAALLGPPGSQPLALARGQGRRRVWACTTTAVPVACGLSGAECFHGSQNGPRNRRINKHGIPGRRCMPTICPRAQLRRWGALMRLPEVIPGLADLSVLRLNCAGRSLHETGEVPRCLIVKSQKAGGTFHCLVSRTLCVFNTLYVVD